jgi:cell division inhibitor SepF
MAKESGKKSFLDFFKGKDIDDDEFDDDLLDDDDFDDDDDEDDYDDYDDDYDKYSSRQTSRRSSGIKQSSNSNTRQFSSTRSQSRTAATSNSGAVRPQTRTGSGSSGKLVEFNGRRGIKSNMNGEVYVIHPKDIEDTDTIVDNLLDGYVIIINLEGVEISTAQRIVDFVGGATKAIDGSIVPVTGNIFVATAHKDSVTGDIREEIVNNVGSGQIGFNY